MIFMEILKKNMGKGGRKRCLMAKYGLRNFNKIHGL